MADPRRFSLTDQLKVIENRILFVVAEFSARRMWIVRATAITLVISLLITFPRVSFFWGDRQIFNVWPLVEWQSNHLFQPLAGEVFDHATKRNFRLLQPMLLYVTQQGWGFGLFVQLMLGILSVALAILITYRLTADRVTSVLTGFAFGQTLGGKIAFLDLGGKGDGFAIFLLLACLAARNAVLLGVLSFLACYTDERAVVAMSLVLLFHATCQNGQLRPNGRVIAVLVAVTLYVATRLWLGNHYGLTTPIGGESAVGFGPFMNNLPGLHVLVPQSLLGFWIAYVLSLIFLVCGGRWLTLAAYVIFPLCLIGVALCVYDVDRSLVYLAPLVFIPFRWSWLAVQEARRLYLVVALICLALPVNAIFGVYTAPGVGGTSREGNLFTVEVVRAITQASRQDASEAPKPTE